MKTILKLTIKKLKNNPLIIILLAIFYLYFLYLLIFLRDFNAGFSNLTLALPYCALIATGGIIKDEIRLGHIDFFIYKIPRSKIILGKFFTLAILAMAYVFLIILSTLVIYLITGEASLILLKIFIKGEVCIVISIYLISIGIFLSCYLKGLMNFVLVFFIEFFVVISLDYINVLELFETGILNLTQKIELALISFLFPHIIILRNNQIFLIVLLFYAFIFLYLSIYKFNNMELKREL